VTELEGEVAERRVGAEVPLEGLGKTGAVAENVALGVGVRGVGLDPGFGAAGGGVGVGVRPVEGYGTVVARSRRCCELVRVDIGEEEILVDD